MATLNIKIPNIYVRARRVKYYIRGCKLFVLRFNKNRVCFSSTSVLIICYTFVVIDNDSAAYTKYTKLSHGWFRDLSYKPHKQWYRIQCTYCKQCANRINNLSVNEWKKKRRLCITLGGNQKGRIYWIILSFRSNMFCFVKIGNCNYKIHYNVSWF